MTLSKVAVAGVDALWLVTARPTEMPVFIVTDTEPIGVKCTPSVDQNEVNVLPRRCSFSHPGAAPGSAPALALVPPATARYCIATPFDGETMASTCGLSPRRSGAIR